MEKHVDQMTDREIAEETLLLLRQGRDVFIQMAENPMLGAMMGNDDPVANAINSRH